MLASPDQQISLTDPDARSMATSGRGSGVVGYNVQVAVETEHHLIVECLTRVATVIAAAVSRPRDLVARYGGEEMAVLLPDTGSAGAAAVAETIRVQVEGLALRHKANLPCGVLTVSIGSASRVPSLDRSRIAPKDLIALADAALYQAKQNGRNRVSVAGTA
jgi:diguanylate cyclase (GGDEF)-like protein